MSRARNIKPGFFKNETLAECHPLARILFQGLWCEADREGRLEDRPRRLKAEYLPYDDADADELLESLASRGFILRYEVRGSRYIQVLAFAKHQNPHIKESASTIPAPCEQGVDSVDESSCNSANTVQAQCKHSASRADSPFLIPDSLKEQHPSDVCQQAKPADPCPHEAIIALWAEVLPELRQPRTWIGARRDHLRARWRESRERQSLEWWRELFGYVRQSDFLMGRVQSRDRRPFDCGLDWLVMPANFAKVIDGNYHATEAA